MEENVLCSHPQLVNNSNPTDKSGKKCDYCGMELTTSEYIKWLEDRVEGQDTH